MLSFLCACVVCWRTQASHGADWKTAAADSAEEPEFMKKDILLYQNPAEADKLTKIQKNLDEVGWRDVGG